MKSLDSQSNTYSAIESIAEQNKTVGLTLKVSNSSVAFSENYITGIEHIGRF